MEPVVRFFCFVLFYVHYKEVRGANSHKRHPKKKNGQNVFSKAWDILTFSTCSGSSPGDICYYN